MREKELEFCYRLIDKIQPRGGNLTIPEYAEKYLYVSINSPRPGKFRLSTFPPLRGPLEDMSPQSHVRDVIIMSAIQTWKTTIIDLVSMYYTDHLPSDQLYISGSMAAATKWRLRRYEPMLNTSGARTRHQIGAAQSKRLRRTGETLASVEYDGRTIDIGTARSAMSLSAETKRVLLADELDRWPADVGGEGHPWDVGHGRITAWGDMAKAIAVSSPLLKGESMIEYLSQRGDYLQYYAICPYCGAAQILERGNGDGKKGLHWETTGGRLDVGSIRYICAECQRGIREHQKALMLDPEFACKKKGETPGWRASKKPIYDNIRSYQLNALYSAFFSWEDYVKEFLESINDPQKEQIFSNQRDGLPYEIVGFSPNCGETPRLRGTYPMGELPEGVLFLTAAVDIQHGQHGWKKSKKKKPPRLELEIKGHGLGYRTYGLGYHVFDGELEDLFSGAWEKFRAFIVGGGFEFDKKSVSLCLIDSGSAEFNEQIFSFCREMGSGIFSPLLGFNVLRHKSIVGEKSHDKRTRRDYDRFRMRSLQGDLYIYDISTNIYKTAIFSRLNNSIQHVSHRKGQGTPAGFCSFAADYPTDYFYQLSSEQQMPNGDFRRIQGRSNEALDIFCYNVAAADIFLTNEVKKLRVLCQSLKKVPPHIIPTISMRTVFRIISRMDSAGRALTPKEIVNLVMLTQPRIDGKVAK